MAHKKTILGRQYPNRKERRDLGIVEVRLDSRVIRKLRESKLTIREFKRRFGIK